MAPPDENAPPLLPWQAAVLAAVYTHEGRLMFVAPFRSGRVLGHEEPS